jgi:hypothetical protein
VAERVRAITIASPFTTRVVWLPVSVTVPLAEVVHRADNTRTAAAAPSAEPMRSVTEAGLPSDGRLTFQVKRQRVPLRGSADIRMGGSLTFLVSTPLKCPAAIASATGARRAWTGIATIGIAAAALPVATTAAASPTTKASCPPFAS